jgi:hypothetical protein
LFLLGTVIPVQAHLLNFEVDIQPGIENDLTQSLSMVNLFRWIWNGHHYFSPDCSGTFQIEGNIWNGPVALPSLWQEEQPSGWLGGQWQSGLNHSWRELLRINEASLKYDWKAWTIAIGRQRFHWGTAALFRPTDYFDPRAPLQLIANDSLGSDSISVERYVFENSNLQSVIRWVGNGDPQEVIRLHTSGIGFTLTPSFAYMFHTIGLGMEVSAVLRYFRVYFEGVDWKALNGRVFHLEAIEGGETRIGKIRATLEILQDGLNEALGMWNPLNLPATYVYVLLKKKFLENWNIGMSVLKSFQGGSWVWSPAVSWAMSSHSSMSLKLQKNFQVNQGPLSELPTIFLSDFRVDF